MKKTIALLLITLLSLSCKENTEVDIIHSELEVVKTTQKEELIPTYPGGHQAYKKYLYQSIIYPDKAMNKKIEGQVIVKFTVGKDGKSKNIQVIKGVGFGCDAEAVRVINSIKNWQPARIDGEPVEVEMAQRIIFRINGDSGPASKPVAITQS